MGRPWALAASARCRGLLLAARGDLDGARVELEAALGHHGDAQQPFELGRTLMAKGQVERRAKQKRAARSSLDQALRTFESLGAPLWAERARSELSRVGGPAAPGELTPDRATGRGARGARAHESRGRGRPVREREDGRGEPLARVPQDGGQDSTRAAACHASSRRGSGIRREPTAASSIGFIPDSPRLRAAYRRRDGSRTRPKGVRTWRRSGRGSGRTDRRPRTDSASRSSWPCWSWGSLAGFGLGRIGGDPTVAPIWAGSMGQGPGHVPRVWVERS